MRDDRDFHYLIRIVYQPRVLIYGLSVVITASRATYGYHSVAVAVLCLLLVLYPHLAYRIGGLFFNASGPARYSLLVDGLLTGLLIVANDLHVLASVSFVAALVMSSLVVAGPAVLAANACIVVLAVLVGLDGVAPDGQDQPLTDALSALTLILYSGLVGHIGFNETVALINRRARLNERQHKLEATANRLRKYVSPQVYASLVAAGDDDLPVKTSRKRLTVFFSDIEGFTRLMDSLDEGTVTRQLNEYLDDMANIALAHGGTVDKFMGDGVMVFFGDPVSAGPADDAVACVRMAAAMRERLATLRKKWGQDLHIRIGIHTGYCTVGNFGAENRMDYTIVGGTVNLASRLESQAGRDEILLSRDTWLLVRRNIVCEAGLPVQLKGIRQPVEVYRVREADCRKSPLPEGKGTRAVIRLLGRGN